MPLGLTSIQPGVTRRNIALEVALSYHGTWYSWGGDDPEGFDCSGLMVEALKSAGLLPRQYDGKARDLFIRYSARQSAPRPGCLVFYGSSLTNITHVEMVVAVINGQVFCIGASGGHSEVKTKKDAMHYNAFIKIRPARADVVAVVDPFQRDE